MKISLRKADAIQRSINEVVQGLELSTEVSINEFERPTDKVAAARDRFAAMFDKRETLLNALYEIRVAVGKQNDYHGINERLATVARLEKEIGQYKRLSALQPAISHDVLIGKLGKLKGREPDPYNRFDDEVRTSIFDEAAIASFKEKLAELKLKKQSVQDELLELNVRVQIELSDATVETLKSSGVL